MYYLCKLIMESKHEQKSLLTAMTKPLWNHHQNGRLRGQVNKESHQAVDNKLPISDIIHNHIVPRLKTSKQIIESQILLAWRSKTTGMEDTR
jgi:hypothetical protein